MIFAMFKRSGNQRVIERLHGDIVAAVRQPSLYADYGVDDTFDARYEVLILCATLLVRRLALSPSPGPEVSQELTDRIFSELDAAMREMGVGDLAVPKRIKKLAAAFLGRRKAYDAALSAASTEQMAASLSRNVYGLEPAEGAARAARLARYAFAVEAAFSAAPLEIFVKGSAPFPKAEAIE
jgi:cytochrome b pre-mRNA-processing protein 3